MYIKQLLINIFYSCETSKNYFFSPLLIAETTTFTPCVLLLMLGGTVPYRSEKTSKNIKISKIHTVLRTDREHRELLARKK